MNVVLLGNPNCGKTTIFNALTGSHARTGNWGGVTVDKKMADFSYQQKNYHLIDLPGVYSLTPFAEHSTLDEEITRQALLDDGVDLVINVIDACHLERHLFLTSQLLELGKPIIVVLNMMDLAKAKGIEIDIDSLSHQLGCCVVALQAHKKVGLSDLCSKLNLAEVSSPLVLGLDREHEDIVNKERSKQKNLYQTLRFLESGGASNAHSMFDGLLFDARYRVIHQIILKVQIISSQKKEALTARIDKVVLDRKFAFPIFLSLMYLSFFFAIKVGGIFQDCFSLLSELIFVDRLAAVLDFFHAPEYVSSVLAYGLGKGISTTLSFVPIIASMYFVLAYLEASGYMARAAFIADKLMRILGLPGQSFVPLLIGFGCNVPGIMASRTLENQRERILTIMMSPFMSCSARLTIYAVFATTFFPQHAHQVIFSLYLIGMLVAFVSGFLLRKWIVTGRTTPLILELPTYHKPSISRLLKETWFRLRGFVYRAGIWIIPACMIVGALETWPIASGQSILEILGKGLTPIFYPMGISADNWPATVGLLSGLIAKEVVIGTLNTLYTSHQILTENVPWIWQVKAALLTIPNHFYDLFVQINPWGASINEAQQLNNRLFEQMHIHFKSVQAAYAYLVFILLYIPCVSTMAVIHQEIGKKWMRLSMFWSLFIAYVLAIAVFQLGQFWHEIILYGRVLPIFLFVWILYRRGKQHYATTSA